MKDADFSKIPDTALLSIGLKLRVVGFGMRGKNPNVRNVRSVNNVVIN
jgi:hypothetical protein